jgi:FkbM family methyltransferase
VELSFWNGEKMLLNAPADLGNFLSDIEGIIIQDQYNVPDLAGKTVIDAGANIGMFSLYALALGAKKIYAFEAVAETFEFFKRNLALNGSPKAIKAVCSALGAKNGKAEIRFSDRGEGSSTIDCGEDSIGQDINFPFRRTVKVAPLDGLVKGRVDLIKIDVEGYEKNVLLGAERLIKKYKPVLSLSAYHRPSDRKTLPEIVRGLRGDYKIKLHRFAEHDFYCE